MSCIQLSCIQLSAFMYFTILYSVDFNLYVLYNQVHLVGQ